MFTAMFFCVHKYGLRSSHPWQAVLRKQRGSIHRHWKKGKIRLAMYQCTSTSETDKKYKLATSFHMKDEVSLPLCTIESSLSWKAKNTLIG